MRCRVVDRDPGLAIHELQASQLFDREDIFDIEKIEGPAMGGQGFGVENDGPKPGVRETERQGQLAIAPDHHRVRSADRLQADRGVIAGDQQTIDARHPRGLCREAGREAIDDGGANSEAGALPRFEEAAAESDRG